MKHSKMLILAMIAAIAAMAFVGTGSASAAIVLKSSLCKENRNPCPALKEWPEHIGILALSSEAVLTGSLAVTCHSTATILTLTNDEHEVLGELTALTWSSCKGCTEATTTTLPSGNLKGTSGGNGTLTTGKAVVLLKGCPLGAECTATATSAALAFNGGAIGTANAKADNVPVSMSGFGCGTTGTWNAGGTHGGKPYIINAVDLLDGTTDLTGSIFFALELES